jgi:hypothetical protein
VDLYLFDFDKTLYAYDFRHRLPEFARLGGVSQYRLASSWWAAGYERRAESGEWPDAEEYLDEFARVTGARRFTLDEWADARRLAMTRIDGSVAALARVDHWLGGVEDPWLHVRRDANLGELAPLLYQGEPKLISLPLTPEEVAYWQAGVPDQVGNPPGLKCNIWEQCAYAFKLLQGGQCRTVALEFDYIDYAAWLQAMRESGGFDVLPESLAATLGPLVFVIEIELSPQRKLAREDVALVMANLAEHGFHLQLPPPVVPLANE